MTFLKRSDPDLKKAVVEEISYQPSVNSTNIGVAVKNGVVTLSGEVDSYPERYLAEKATLRVRGVSAVAEEITVRNSEGATDSSIAQEAHEALERAVDVPADTITVMVKDHAVTLSGTTRWHFQRVAAARAVRYLKGVTGIHNDVTITPDASAAGIKDAINGALVRDAELEARKITVHADGGHVTLDGHVHSRAELIQADWAAWSAPGVTNVTSNLTVTP
jgi:osmotically-inducible protein OsmY